jgi:hypothetical protein
MPSARITIPSPLTVYELNDTPERGRRIPIEVDCSLEIDAEFSAIHDPPEVVLVSGVKAISGTLWVGRVQVPEVKQETWQQIAAEWWMVPKNQDWLLVKCEESWLKQVGGR